MQLSDLFSEIVEVDTNPYKLQIEEVFKLNGELKKESREEVYNLISYDNLDEDIINHILKNSQNKCLQKDGNFLTNIFSKHPITKLVITDEFAISNDKILSKIKCENKITYQIDELILAKKTRLLINKENKLFYINSEDYKVYSIK
jgi:hypothetical protein